MIIMFVLSTDLWYSCSEGAKLTMPESRSVLHYCCLCLVSVTCSGTQRRAVACRKSCFNIHNCFCSNCSTTSIWCFANFTALRKIRMCMPFLMLGFLKPLRGSLDTVTVLLR